VDTLLGSPKKLATSSDPVELLPSRFQPMLRFIVDGARVVVVVLAVVVVVATLTSVVLVVTGALVEVLVVDVVVVDVEVVTWLPPVENTRIQSKLLAQ
jgi:hypothetical protein